MAMFSRRVHNSKKIPYLNFPPQILSLFHHNHSSFALFGLFLLLFWPVPPTKTAQKVPESYVYGETKRELAILFLNFEQWVVSNI